MFLDKHLLCVAFGFMIDKMSIFPFVFGVVVGAALNTTSTISLAHIQQQFYERFTAYNSHKKIT